MVLASVDVSISWVLNVLRMEHQRSRSVYLRELPSVDPTINVLNELSIAAIHPLLEPFFGRSEQRLPLQHGIVVSTTHRLIKSCLLRL